MTTLYLVRHGESEGNAAFDRGLYLENTLMGSCLTAVGIQQSKEVAQKLKKFPVKAIYSSHLCRAQMTAKIIAQEFNFPVYTREKFKERVKGKLNGKSEEEIRRHYPFIFGDPNTLSHEEMLNWKLFTDMETAQETISRFINELKALSHTHPHETIVVVTHGNVLRCFLADLEFGSFQQLGSGSVKNCAYIKISTDTKNFFIHETVGVKLHGS